MDIYGEDAGPGAKDVVCLIYLLNGDEKEKINSGEEEIHSHILGANAIRDC